MRKHLLHAVVHILHVVFRHASVFAAAFCFVLTAHHFAESHSRTTLHQRVQAHDRSSHAVRGATVNLDNALTLFLPAGWTDISAVHPQAAHPAWVAAYQGCDALGRRLTASITRWEGGQPWIGSEDGALNFSCWFAGRGQTCYRVFVSAESAFCASSSSLCRELSCMLRSIRSVSP